ncbi:GNAT family N-acetyltransferase [Mesorhizobium sp. BAC0120]|uniref:GNAT family N-acetyltransferase n=1 Tax=Mesorhizobium sp. BAC0120 TaxID=3090670 RepID=UPI00298C505D|nr:GNAT family N-acetyltransferase [Mesorhizobium sp. BAC0120]MDW6023577.1 GNAT family N-acetyltransferase [Mesorhizobium sp. BAC0120]
MNAHSLHAEIIRAPEALEASCQGWWELWRRCSSATPFQMPPWLMAWWRCFAPGELATIAVWRGSRLVGLAPFYDEQSAQGHRLLPLGISVSDYLDVLIEPEGQESIGAAMIDAGRSLAWQSWELEELHPDAHALALPCPDTLCCRRVDQSVCPVIELRGKPDLAGCVPARRRRQLRRAQAAANRIGEATITAAQSRPSYFLDHLFRLHAACWQVRGEAGVLDHPAVRRFHREVLPILADHGVARCYLLDIGGIVAGAYYGFLDRGRAYAYIGGFDPEFAEQSPGSILIGHAIAEAIRAGASEFHFLRGRESYKYSWGAVDRLNQKLVYSRVP